MRLRLLLLLALAGPAMPCHARSIAECGGRPDGSDTAPAWNACLALAAAGPDRTIAFDGGVYVFATRPNPITVDGITITGTDRD